MESRLSWHRAQHAAETYDVTVVCARRDAAGRGEAGDDRETTVAELPTNRVERALMSTTITFYLGYRLWQRRVYRLARRLHAERPFDLVHQVSFCGYREPGDCWKLGIPFVLGPVGGTQPFPWRFLGELDALGGIREVLRNIVNACQLRFAIRVRRAMHSARAVMAANRAVARDLERNFDVTPRVLLETGVSDVRTIPRPPRDPREPLKILWAGRLRPWKALPLLLRALATLPPECQYVLRVLGQGPCEARWRRIAARLGVANCVEWAGWSPDHKDQLPHYDWADVFAFTSLRDTSGTGLLEALAAGAPIIGLDHQGARDVMTNDCAVPIPVTAPPLTIAALRQAVERLATDVDLLTRLSAGALQRATEFTWRRQWEETREIYDTCQRAPSADSEPLQLVAEGVGWNATAEVARHSALC
jgi:glycosyltransferase involved in cell wall biosynthesis